MKKDPLYVALCASLVAGIGVGCGDDEDTPLGTSEYAYEDNYAYGYDYPADVAYSGMYWGDAWDDGATLYQGETGTTQRSDVGSAIRALARGESVCPGQVSVTPKTGTPACGGDNATTGVRNGVTIVFNNCQLTGGGTVSGTFDVTAMRTASEAACSASTTITLDHTTTITNLSYTGPNGARLVIPSQTDTGHNTYTYGQVPSKVTIDSKGQLQIYDADSVFQADLTATGTRTYAFSVADRSYSVSGTVTSHENVSGGSATLVGTNITRTMGCCRPTGGTLEVTRSGGARPGSHTWMFSNTCGQAIFDGNAIMLPTCY